MLPHSECPFLGNKRFRLEETLMFLPAPSVPLHPFLNLMESPLEDSAVVWDPSPLWICGTEGRADRAMENKYFQGMGVNTAVGMAKPMEMLN